MEVRYLLFESASGYALVERKGSEEIGVKSEESQRAMTDFGRFSQICSLKAFKPFTSAENALENINDVSDGMMTDDLREFLESNLAKSMKGGKEKAKFALGVSDPKVGGTVQEATGIPCVCNELCLELIRGVRLHFSKLVKVRTARAAAAAKSGLCVAPCTPPRRLRGLQGRRAQGAERRGALATARALAPRPANGARAPYAAPRRR